MNLSEVLFYFILPIAAGIYLFLKKKFSYFKELGIPHLEPSWPFGNVSGLGNKMHLFDLGLKLHKEFNEKDGICGLYNTIQRVFVINEPEVAKNIMVKDFNNFVNRGVFMNEKEPLTGKKKEVFQKVKMEN